MAKSSKVLIMTEDFYGKDFFRELINRLNTSGLVRKSPKIKLEWFPGKCNPKLGRKLLSKSRLDKIIIVVDAEGDNKTQVKASVEKHVPQNLRQITRYVVFNYCIEEWICEGMGIQIGFQHPVDCLNDYLRRTKGEDYEKYMLPDFAERIDVNILLTNNQEFKAFVNYLNCK
ncbi:hypothetical protein DRP04_10875 [Archaeoglobales archaeon]|nr:MAG: hypothetical protein DRP04_10875 [Archaeoglobales archaeon]